MLKKRLTLLTILLLFTINSFACLNAYQHKMFPIGIQNEQMISVDFEILRTSAGEAERDYGLIRKPNVDEDKIEFAWKITSHIVHYNFKQEPLEITVLDSVVLEGEDYSKGLELLYIKAFAQIKDDYKSIELFEIGYLSFCDYQKKCNEFAVEYDTIQKAGFGIYDNQKYELKIFTNEKIFGIHKSQQEYTLRPFYLNSIRIYETPKRKIVVGHLQYGHEIMMGIIKTDDSEPEGDFEQIIPEEKESKLPEKSLVNFSYQEPLLHHGYGFDVFVVVE